MAVPIIAPGSTLAVAALAAATALTVTNNSATGASLANTEDFRLFDVSGLPTLVTEAYTAADGTYETNAAPATSILTVPTGIVNAYPAGSLIQNIEAGSILVENTDYIFDYTNGQVRFIDGGAATPGGFYVVDGEYENSPATYVNLGTDQPILEFSVRLEHTFPDGRTLTFFAPRASVTPDSPSIGFDPTDWASAEVSIEILKSEDPAYADRPFGYMRIGHNSLGQDPGTSAKAYTAGVFDLYLTPLDATIAANKGFSLQEFSMGNITVGAIEGPQEFLEHYAGLPQSKDASIRLKKEINITATIDMITPRNLALLFDGVLQTDATAAYSRFAQLIQVPASLTIPTWVPVSYRNINYA